MPAMSKNHFPLCCILNISIVISSSNDYKMGSSLLDFLIARKHNCFLSGTLWTPTSWLKLKSGTCMIIHCLLTLKFYIYSSPIHYSVILFTHLPFGWRLNYIKGTNGVQWCLPVLPWSGFTKESIGAENMVCLKSMIAF